MANVYYDENVINSSDYVNAKDHTFNLESINNTDKDLILLYIYILPKFPTHGYKVGMTKWKDGESIWHAIKSRINNQEHELALSPEQYTKYGNDREVVYWGVCLDANKESFKDYHVHKKIKERYIGLTEQNQEWFNGLPLDDIVDIFNTCRLEGEEKVIYTPRKEQQECVDRLNAYFNNHPTGGRFLLNCKMRFGKCYTTYKFAETANIDKILILTFVPAVEESWRDDLLHIKKEYEYFTDANLKRDSFSLENQNKPYVVFLSLQNYLGKDAETSATKEKIKKLQGIDFDLVVFDEYHFGAWNDRTQETVLEDFDPSYAKAIKNGAGEQDILKKFQINTKKTICLSGTPFKSLAKGEFTKDNSFTYSYFDEQKNKYPEHEKDEFKKVVNSDYEHFPDMKIFGYNMSKLFGGLDDHVMSNDKILNKKYFSLNAFFETKKESNINLANEFIYEEEIETWLEIVKGASVHGGDFPYSNPKMLSNNKHTLWLMPKVSSCAAMKDLLEKDEYFKKYEIVNLSAHDVGAGQKALDFLKLQMTKAQNTGKLGTIALTVNKLTMGVTVKPWMSVFVLKDLASPESYFQSIFRIQTPYVENGEILKKEAFVYDFNIDRAAALMLKFAEQSQDRSVTKMQICKLIVKYMPIYVDGNMSSPIDYSVFYNLATLGDTSGVPLSRRIKNLEQTTRLADDDVISCMLNDPNVSEVLKRVFAHSKITKSKDKTSPTEPPKGFKSPFFLKGLEDGHKVGLGDSEELKDFDDLSIQAKFDELLAKRLRENIPDKLSFEETTNYHNGFSKGYEGGVNAPIKKLQCGKEDGKKFADSLKTKYGANLYYEGSAKATIDNETKTYLNDTNVPIEFSSSLYKRWYKDSFLKSVRNNLKRPKNPNGDGDTVESANNVLQHLISRLFQFLYISVYRETTFDEIFKNADPNTFLEAVGITKEDFSLINRYRVFQEDVLNNYIHEFFENEDLGHKLNMTQDIVKKNYRNSFGWFGYNDLVGEVQEYIREIENEQTLQEINEMTPNKEVEQSDDIDDEFKLIEVPECYIKLNDFERKVYSAVYIIGKLSPTILCKPFIKTITNYLTGNTNSAYYQYFNGQSCCGSVGFFEKFKIEKTLKALVNKGVIKVISGKKDAYHIK